MITLNFGIAMPWRSAKIWDILWNKSGYISEHKAWEFNGYRTGYLINVDFHWTLRGDHAGARLMFGAFGYEIELEFYDTRHWNYDANTWECYK